jgi:hypothetical protein
MMQYGVCAHEYVSQWVCIGLPRYGPLTFIDFAQDDPWDRVVDEFHQPTTFRTSRFSRTLHLRTRRVSRLSSGLSLLR